MDSIKSEKRYSKASLASASGPYPDSRFYRKDKPVISLGNPSSEYKKHEVKVPQWG